MSFRTCTFVFRVLVWIFQQYFGAWKHANHKYMKKQQYWTFCLEYMHLYPISNGLYLENDSWKTFYRLQSMTFVNILSKAFTHWLKFFIERHHICMKVGRHLGGKQCKQVCHFSFFWFEFNSPSRLFHSFWAEPIARWEKPSDHLQAELGLSHVTRARLEPTAVRWWAI